MLVLLAVVFLVGYHHGAGLGQEVYFEFLHYEVLAGAVGCLDYVAVVVRGYELHLVAAHGGVGGIAFEHSEV